MEDVFVPVTLFVVIGVIFLSAYYFSYRKRSIVYDAIKVAIEKTGQVDAALVEAIIRDKIGPNADLRKGILLIAVAAAFVILGYTIDDAEAIGPLMGVASFPGLIGVCYIA
ncbi:MAG TPA: DUF6249 domain-containing protein, partial [Amphiplicatus sp.]|nr:DUF6249 domain-containing protein [Amphiplicatus sp.]